MQPHIGQIVHFFTAVTARQRPGMGEGPYAATIVQIRDGGAVDLTVFYPGDVRFITAVPRAGANHWAPIEARAEARS